MTRNFNLGLIVSAAILTLSAAVGYGQDYGVSANIPFAFSLNGSNMPSGQYNVEWLLRNKKVMQFENAETGQIANVLIRSPKESKGDRPYLAFYCAERSCALAEISFGLGHGWEFSQPQAKRGDRGHLATIYLDQNSRKANRVTRAAPKRLPYSAGPWPQAGSLSDRRS